MNFVCKTANCQNIISRQKNIYFKKINDDVHCSLFEEKLCSDCSIRQKCDLHLQNKTFWLIIKCIYDSKSFDDITIFELPREIIVSNKKYRLLLGKIHETNHFTSIFYINKRFYGFDDLKNKVFDNKVPVEHRIESCLYYLV